MSAMRQGLPLAAVAVVLAALSGCGDGSPSIVPVTGVLTYKGKPVPNVIVEFTPEKGRPSWGQTDADGRFTLEYDATRKGALVGKHQVMARLGPGAQKVPGEKAESPAHLQPMFEKYGSDKSPAHVVIESGTKEIQLEWD